MKLRALLALFTLIALASVLLFWFWGLPTSDTTSPATPDTTGEESTPADSRGSNIDMPSPIPNRTGGSNRMEDDPRLDEEQPPRVAVEVPVLSGRLTTPDGSAVAGAELTWTPMLESVVDGKAAPNWEEIESITQRTRTGEDGTFGFASEPSVRSAYGSVIWATHPDHEALPILIQGMGQDLPGFAVHVLPAVTRGTVRVVEEDGAPVTGAAAEQTCPFPDRRGPRWELPVEVRARAVLRRTMITDAEGQAPLLAFPEVHEVWASKEGRVAEPWRGAHRPEVTLVLRAAFTARGSVLVEGETREPGPRPFVSCGAVRGEQVEELITLPVDDDWTWGPVEMPLMSCDRFRFRMEGAWLVPQDVFVEPPDPGGEVIVDFETATGHDIWYLMTDAAHEIVTPGEVTIRWPGERGWTSLTTPTRSDGYVEIRGCPAGRIEGVATAPGYAREVLEAEMVPPPEPQVVRIEMTRSGTLRGRCVHRGEGVENFDLVLWSATDPAAVIETARHEVRGSSDGSFEWDEAPEGRVSVVAAAPGFGQSKVHQISLSATRPSEVVLKVLDPITGRGRVVDQVTGEPLSDAEVQLRLGNDRTRRELFGPAIRTGADGTFELSDLSSVPSTFVVRAEGHAEVARTVRGIPGEVLDLGVIALERTQTLAVKLVSDTPIDATRYVVGSQARPEEIPMTRFGADGELRFESVSAGPVFLVVDHPEGGRLFGQKVLVAGWPWSIELPVEGTRRLLVEVESAPGFEMPRAAMVSVSFENPNQDSIIRSIPIEGEGRYVLDGMPDTMVNVALQSLDEANYLASLGAVSGAFRGGKELELRIVAGADLQRVRVRDGSGTPLPGVRVMIGTAGMVESCVYDITDAQGECSLVLSPRDPLFAALESEVHGHHFGIPIQRPSDPEQVIELELVADGRLDFLLRDGGTPASGLTCRLEDATLGRSSTLPVRSSDSEGRAVWEKLANGEFLFRAHHPDYLPAREIVRPSHSLEPRVIQVRRTGAVTFELVSQSGASVAGLPIQLHSVEFDKDVAEWVSINYVVPPPRGLVTDATGRLFLDDLPHGEYVWRVTPPGGEPQEGRASVIAGGQVHAPIILP